MATRAPERRLIKSFFLAIGQPNPHHFFKHNFKWNQLLWDETTSPKRVIFFRYEPIISIVCFFYCIYNTQNFIPKNLDNALIEFVQTLLTSGRLSEVQAPLSDFLKNLLVPRNTTASKTRNDVISLLWQLRCQYNTNYNKFSSLCNTAVVTIFRYHR